MRKQAGVALLTDLETIPSRLIQQWISASPQYELSRISRFRSTTRIRQFVVARQLLKTLLSQKLGLENPEIRPNPQGVPQIVGENVFCSLSHSGSALLAGYSREGPIGLDIEKWRCRSFSPLVQEYFHPDEHRVFQELTANEQPKWFYDQWVRKEALAKRSGDGVTLKSLSRIPDSASCGLLILELPGYSAAIAGSSPPDLWLATVSGDKIELSTW